MPELGPAVDGNPFDKAPKLGPAVGGNPFAAKLGPPVEGNPFEKLAPAQQQELAPPQGEPSDVAASAKGAENFLGSGVASLKMGAQQAAQGAKETVTEFPERYAAAHPPPGVESGPLGRTITGPAYRAGAAIMTSPAAEAANQALLGAWGTEGGISTEGLGVKAKIGSTEKPVDGQVAPPELPPHQGPAGELPAPATGPSPGKSASWGAWPNAEKPAEPKLGPPVEGNPFEKPITLEKKPPPGWYAENVGPGALTKDFSRFEEPNIRPLTTPKEPPNVGGAVQAAEPGVARAGPQADVQTPGTFRGPKPGPSTAGAATPTYPELHAMGQEPGKALLQQQLGLADREATQAVTRLEPYQKQFNQLPREKRLDTIGYMENRSKGASISPELKPAADIMRGVYKDIEYKWGEMKPDMTFVEDYFRHAVKQPKDLSKFMSSWKEGSARGAGQKRSFPTVSDLMDAGHELVNDNPVETTMDYAFHMSRYLGAEKAFQLAREHGAVKYYKPDKAPEGWVPLQGRHGEANQYGMVPHAPAEFAKPWNAFAGEGFTGLAGDIVHGARQITNMVTAIKLMSGYHVLTMGAASFTSELSRAFTNLARGKPIDAGKVLANAATVMKPILSDTARGWRGQRIYSGEGMQGAPIRGAMSRFLARETPEENKVMDYLTMANARPNKIDKSMSMSMQGNLATAWKRGALSGQLSQYKSNIADAPGLMKSIPIAKGVMDLAGRAIQTIMSPMFNVFIPKIKLGMGMTQMQDWLRANPAAPFEDIMQQARTVQRNMDDRFGEMVQDNLFWNQKLKEGLQTAMLSYSWNVGIGRALGGGAKDIGTGKFTERAAYAIAFPIGAAYLGAVYQGLKTGKYPGQDSGTVGGTFQDLLAPQTGGTNPATKFRQETPERALIPGHMKDVNDLYQVVTGTKSLLDVATNKLNPALKIAGNLATGKDWRGDVTADPESSIGSRIMQHLGFALGEMAPIPFEGLKHQSATSGMNLFETVMGVRRAPDMLQDPTGNGDMLRAAANKDYVTKLHHDLSQATKEGDQEKAGIIQQEIRRREPKKLHKMRIQ